MKETTKIKIGIYAMAVLMMGIVGVSGALTVIGAQFPSASQSMIQSIISIPCLAVLPVTIISGKLMEIMHFLLVKWIHSSSYHFLFCNYMIPIASE